MAKVPYDNIWHKSNLEHKGCVLCGGGDELFKAVDGFKGFSVSGGSYDIEFCRRCSMGKTRPFPDADILKEVYSSTLYRAEDGAKFHAPIERIVRYLKVRRCKQVEWFSKKGRILDIGCGRSDFLALMAKRGWETTGLEVDERAASYGKNILGLDVRAGSLEEQQFPDASFDVVTLWHVLEHIHSPDLMLEECNRILKPGGLLVVAVPNMDSFQEKMAGRHWFHLDVPYHLYHFSSSNLMRLLDKFAFDSISVRHFSLELNPFGWLQSTFNLCGVRANMLYEFLKKSKLKAMSRKKGPAFYASAGLMALSLPFVLPLSVLLSIVEAALGFGGTIEVYAQKRVR